MNSRGIQPPLLTIEGLRPLVAMEEARRAVARFVMDEHDIMDAIDRGEIEWAFNISTGAEVKEVRLVDFSFQEYLAWLQNPKWQRRSTTLDGILRSLFPQRGGKAFVKTPEVARAFDCTADHVLHLLDAQLLKEVPGSRRFAGGSNGSGAAMITWESVLAFLKARKL